MIELRLHGQHLYADRRPLLHAQEGDDHVRDLHAGIVNVVLNLHAVAGVPQDTRHGVAEDGVAHMADMRGFVGIDAGVFDDDFARPLRGRRCLSRRGFPQRFPPERGAIEERVQVAGSGNFHSRDTFDGADFGGDFLSNLPRRTLELLGKLETHGRSNFAHLQTRRARNRHVGGDVIAPTNELLQSSLKPPCERVVHEPPYGREKPKSIGKRRPVARGR